MTYTVCDISIRGQRWQVAYLTFKVRRRDLKPSVGWRVCFPFLRRLISARRRVSRRPDDGISRVRPQQSQKKLELSDVLELLKKREVCLLWANLHATMHRGGAPTRRPIMRNLITTIAWLAWVGHFVAIGRHLHRRTRQQLLLATPPSRPRQLARDQSARETPDGSERALMKSRGYPSPE